MKKIAVLVGSLSANSINRSLAKAMERLAGGRLEFDFLEIGELPFYNDDLWALTPSSVVAFKSRVERADGVLVVMPEFNRSFPAVIKNALDWASRPYGQNAWSDKPLALTGASPGAIGTAAGQSQLRSTLPIYGFVVMGQPELYFQWRPGLIDDHHEITDDQTRAFVAGFVDKFVEWVDRHVQQVPAVAAE